jgi:UDP-glucose 4-epimerase
MSIKNKRILLTGGTGLVGKHVTRLLTDAGAEVVSFTRKHVTSDNPHVTYITCDLRDLKRLHDEGNLPPLRDIDYLVYIAANIPQLHEKKETLLDAKENTLDPFLYVMEYYARNVKKIVYTSTIDIYGYPGIEQFDENTRIDPPTPYAIAKYAGEEYLKMYAKMNKSSYTILRFSQVYGENEPFVRVIPFVIDAALHNKSFTMWGNPQNKRKFLYAEDAAKAVIAGLEYEKNGIFQIAGSEEITIAQIVEIVEEVTGKKMIVEHKNADSPMVHLTPSTSLAEKELKFNAKTLFKDGIAKVISSYEHN